MSDLSNYRIMDEDVAQHGVIAAPDRLTGTAAENKAVFDRLIRNAVKEKYNGMLTTVGAHLVWETYDAKKAYVPGNKVISNGSSYLCTSACTGVLPADGTHWRQVAAVGTRIGSGAPTPSTVGAVGQHYFDKDADKEYICTDVSVKGGVTTYTWKQSGGGNSGGGGGGIGGGVTLKSIAVTTPPKKTSYFAGEAFDPTGMVVRATYSNGAVVDIVEYTVSPEILVAGMTYVTITHTEGGVSAAAMQAVTVSKRTPTITATPDKVSLSNTNPTATFTVTTDSDGAIYFNDNNVDPYASVTVVGNKVTVTSNNIKSIDGYALGIGVKETSLYKDKMILVFVTIELSRLPQGYTELKYLGTDKNAYIDTKLDGHDPFRLMGTLLVTDYANSGNERIATLCGVFQSGPWNGAYVRIGDYSSSVGQGTAIGAAGNVFYFTSVSDGVEHSIDADGETGSMTVDGAALVKTKTSSNSPLSGMTLYLFNWNRTSGTVAGNATFRFIGDVKFYRKGALIAQLVPARRNSDSVPGMYDLVTKTFFTNAGAGTFIAGPAV